jgi:hypothetical protein
MHERKLDNVGVKVDFASVAISQRASKAMWNGVSVRTIAVTLGTAPLGRTGFAIDGVAAGSARSEDLGSANPQI